MIYDEKALLLLTSTSGCETSYAIKGSGNQKNNLNSTLCFDLLMVLVILKDKFLTIFFLDSFCIHPSKMGAMALKVLGRDEPLDPEVITTQ